LIAWETFVAKEKSTCRDKMGGTEFEVLVDGPVPDTPQRGSPMPAQASGLGNGPTK
jgi:hypothetical protein